MPTSRSSPAHRKDLDLVGPASIGPLGAARLRSAVPECPGDELTPAPELETPRRRRRHRHLPRRRRPSGCLARRPPRARPGRMPGRATPGPRQSRPRRSGTASSWFPQDLPDRVVRHRSAVGADAHSAAEGTGRGRQRPRSPAPGCRADRPARQRVGRAHRLRSRGTDVRPQACLQAPGTERRHATAGLAVAAVGRRTRSVVAAGVLIVNGRLDTADVLLSAA